MSLQFFYDNGGQFMNPTEEQQRQMWESAAAHSKAEAFALEVDWQFEWGEDSCAWFDRPEDENGEPVGKEPWYCELKDKDGEFLASLCGIWDPDPSYKRIVEAQLALQAMAEAVK